MHVPACVTVKSCPAIVMVPVRELAAVFAARLIVTVPLPLPLAPATIVIQDVELDAVHAQPLVAVTVTLSVPPPCPTDTLDGLMLYAQGCPACVTVNVCPPIVIVPVLGELPVFAATL